MSENDLLKFAAVIFGTMFVTLGVLFLIFREVVCWYWKINQTVRLLTSIDQSLQRMVAQQHHAANGGWMQAPASAAYPPNMTGGVS
jgi:hypothetical protein